MRRRWVRWMLLGLLVVLPVLIHQAYKAYIALPEHITLATGVPGGRYRVVSEKLAEEIERRLPVSVKTLETEGSVEHLQLLAENQVDFALYQPNTQQVLKRPEEVDLTHIRFVATLYSEVAHILVHRDAKIETPEDFRGKRISLGRWESGDAAVSRMLLEHFGLKETELVVERWNYEQVRDGFLNNELDAAIIMAGQRAPVLRQLLASGKCRLMSIPYAKSLAAKRLSVSLYMIPAGYYRTFPAPEPAEDVQTVALTAQLLTREDVSTALVEEVTRLVLREDFLREAELMELFTQGREFARRRPEFPTHDGALHVYEPEFKPMLDTDFVESTEGIRSFVVSSVIAIFLLFRWYRSHLARTKEHRLDRYIREMMEIEKLQSTLDRTAGKDDLSALQDLLAKVSQLRREALREFSAHDLNEDRATDCFLEFSHALSEKINTKITRQRLEQQIRTLRDKRE